MTEVSLLDVLKRDDLLGQVVTDDDLQAFEEEYEFEIVPGPAGTRVHDRQYGQMAVMEPEEDGYRLNNFCDYSDFRGIRGV